MLKDGLIPLPPHVTATLLRALMQIRPRPENRLTLRRSEHDRAPNWDAKNDHDVIFRGQTVGRAWCFQYRNHPWAELGPWLWRWNGVPGRPDTEGHAPTLEWAMADFRRAWDNSVESGVA